MKNVRRPAVSLTLLLLIGSVLLVWTAVLLAGFWYQEFASTHPAGVIAMIGTAIASVIFLSMTCGLVVAALWLISVAFGWRPHHARSEAVRETYRGVDAVVALRGRDRLALHLVLIGCLGSFWVFFLQDDLWLTVGWGLSLPILTMAMPYSPKSRLYPRMLLYCCLLLMMAGMKAKFLNDGTPLFFFSAFWLSMAITLPIVFLTVLLKVSNTGELDWGWRLLLALPVGCFVAFFYTGPLLAFFNSYLDDPQNGRVYPAVITQKCAPYEAPLLRVSVIHEQGKAEHLIDFRLEVFEHGITGDTVSVRVQQGRFGWPWYKGVQDEPIRLKKWPDR